MNLNAFSLSRFHASSPLGLLASLLPRLLAFSFPRLLAPRPLLTHLLASSSTRLLSCSLTARLFTSSHPRLLASSPPRSPFPPGLLASTSASSSLPYLFRFSAPQTCNLRFSLHCCWLKHLIALSDPALVFSAHLHRSFTLLCPCSSALLLVCSLSSLLRRLLASLLPRRIFCASFIIASLLFRTSYSPLDVCIH